MRQASISFRVGWKKRHIRFSQLASEASSCRHCESFSRSYRLDGSPGHPCRSWAWTSSSCCHGRFDPPKHGLVLRLHHVSEHDRADFCSCTCSQHGASRLRCQSDQRAQIDKTQEYGNEITTDIRSIIPRHFCCAIANGSYSIASLSVRRHQKSSILIHGWSEIRHLAPTQRQAFVFISST